MDDIGSPLGQSVIQDGFLWRTWQARSCVSYCAKGRVRWGD